MYIVYCIAIYGLTGSFGFAQHKKGYTNCVNVGEISVNQTPLVNSPCLSAMRGSMCAQKLLIAMFFSYDRLSEICVFYQSIICQLNVENGGTTFTKVTGKKNLLLIIYCLKLLIINLKC